MACYQGPGCTTPSIHVFHPTAHHSLKTAPMLMKLGEQQLDMIIQTPILHTPCCCKLRQSSEAIRVIGDFSCSGDFLLAPPMRTWGVKSQLPLNASGTALVCSRG